ASRCDTEVIPHLYENEPDVFERRLEGMFALAVWDARRRRAVLVRDRLGIKPLYWARRGDLVVFASELKSLLASGLVEPEPGHDSSLVVALMARHTAGRVRTFSIGFAGAGDHNELEDARLVANLFDTEHHELELSFDEEAVALDELVWSLDEPLADLSALGFH